MRSVSAKAVQSDCSLFSLDESSVRAFIYFACAFTIVFAIERMVRIKLHERLYTQPKKEKKKE